MYIAAEYSILRHDGVCVFIAIVCRAGVMGVGNAALVPAVMAANLMCRRLRRRTVPLCAAAPPNYHRVLCHVRRHFLGADRRAANQPQQLTTVRSARAG